ncbi:MAG: hypothetical protein LBI79_05475 [Nitrososphaerota archaeon]|jgi:hypothetical protein|nr:hypothetical protein [Nitrososphaerota archaeon]
MRRNALIAFMFTLFLISSLLEYSYGALPPTPNTPNFSTQVINRSYNVPPTTSTDPYTGKPLVQEGYYVKNYTIEITIKNQPYTPTIAEDGSHTNELYYNFRFKGHFSDEWIDTFNVDCPKQSNATYTVLTLGPSNSPYLYLSPGDVVDIQVRALSGHFYRRIDFGSPWYFEGQKSDWSSTQTITIPEDNSVVIPSSSAPASQNPPTEPLQPDVGSAVFFGLGWVGVVAVVLLVVVMALLTVIVFLQTKIRKLL